MGYLNCLAENPEVYNETMNNRFLLEHRFYSLMLFKKDASKKKKRLKEEHIEVGVSVGPFKAGKKWVYEPTEEGEAARGPKSSKEEPLWRVTEREVTIKPREYEPISLGHLGDGALVDIHAREIYGMNISVLIMDKENLEKYHETAVSRGAIWGGFDLPEHEDTIQIGRTAEYFIVITSRAVEKNRNVWLKVDVKS